MDECLAKGNPFEYSYGWNDRARGNEAKGTEAQAWLVKQYISAEELDTAIQQAVTSIKSIQ